MFDEYSELPKITWQEGQDVIAAAEHIKREAYLHSIESNWQKIGRVAAKAWLAIGRAMSTYPPNFRRFGS